MRRTKISWRLVLVYALVCRSSVSSRPAGPEIALAQGLMAGEVTQDSVIFQSRLTSPAHLVDRRWSGIPGHPGVGRFELATSPDFRKSLKTDWMHAQPEYDYLIKAKVTGLRPGTRYYYRLVYGVDRGPTRTSTSSTFRTHSGQAIQPFSFAVVTGMNYSFFHYLGGGAGRPPYSGPNKDLGYPALERILEPRPDYFVGTGDNVYYDHPTLGRAETLHQMRMKYQEQFSQPRFINLFSKVATYWMKDDHDYRFNDSDPVNPYLVSERVSDERYPKENIQPRISGSGHLPAHQTGVTVFQEQLPVVDPSEKDPVTYRTYRLNKLLQIWFVEGRDYRSPNDLPDGPEKTIWGKAQRAWLQRTLLESDSAFKILFTPTPMIGPDSRRKRDNHVNPRGFRHEGESFFRWLTDRGFLGKHFYIVCGDRHWQYHAIHPSGFEEFSCGALFKANTARGYRPGDPNSSDPEGTIKQPYQSPEFTGGFLVVGVEAHDSVAVAEFRFYDETGRLLYRLEKRARLP